MTTPITDTLPHERPLTLEQGGKFQSLQIPFDNVGIMSGSFQGAQVGIMFAEDGGKIEPLAMILDKEFMSRYKGELLDMNGSEVQPQTEASLIIDPSKVDRAMLESVMTGIIGAAQ